MLTIREDLPEGLLQAPVTALQDLLGGPTRIHLPGRRPEPLFLSVLLHGNEDTGYYAAQSLLREHHTRELPRALSVFIANVAAARLGLRRLDGQVDYNRIWPGCDKSMDTPEHAMMARVVDEMRRRKVFASVDVHNNTGINPHYGCVNRLDHRFIRLAAMFSRTVVYFTRPSGVQSMAFASLCPAVTVECGKAGQALGVEHAREFLEGCLHLSAIPDHPMPAHDVDLFHTVAIVKVPDGCRFGFGETPAHIRFVDELDRLNFRELPEDTLLGWADGECDPWLEAWDEQGREVGERYFRVEDGELRTIRPVMPSMFTLDERIIRQDCLGYLLERLPLEAVGRT